MEEVTDEKNIHGKRKREENGGVMVQDPLRPLYIECARVAAEV